jgi:hypothetical protein
MYCDERIRSEPVPERDMETNTNRNTTTNTGYVLTGRERFQARTYLDKDFSRALRSMIK